MLNVLLSQMSKKTVYLSYAMPVKRTFRGTGKERCFAAIFHVGCWHLALLACLSHLDG